MMQRSVIIDCYAFEGCVQRIPEGAAVVVVDVFRATTTALTCVGSGRRCHVAPSVELARGLAKELGGGALLIGEVAGEIPQGFDLDNSPAALATLGEPGRPAVLVSSSGVPLMFDAAPRAEVYAACLRNWTAQARHLAETHERVAVIGAGTRGEFREEDQLGCAWIAGALADLGLGPGDEQTHSLITRYRAARVDVILASNSTKWLRANHKERDIEFVLEHVDDLDEVLSLRGHELAPIVSLVPGAAGWAS